MTAPVLVLAVLTIGGWLAQPARHSADRSVAPAQRLARARHWHGRRVLAGSSHLEHSTELMLIGTAIAIALLGIGIAFARYRSPVPRKVDARRRPDSPRWSPTRIAWTPASIAWSCAHSGALLCARAVAGPRSGAGAPVRAGWAVVGARCAGYAHDRLGAGDVGRYAWVIALGVIAMLAAFTVR
jgi:hypothetical protein